MPSESSISLDPGTHVHQQIICANVFIRQDDRFLVLRRSPHKRYAPGIVHPVGGKLEPGENPFAGAEREALEETGLRVKNMRLEAVLLDIEPVQGEPYNWLVYHFSADYASGEVSPTPEGELIWLTAEELINERLHASVRPIIREILDRDKGVVFTTNEYDQHKTEIIEIRRDVCAPHPVPA